MTAPATTDTPPKPRRKDAAKADVPRRTIAEVIRRYDPDHRWFVPVIAGLLAYSLAGAIAMTPLPSWVLVAPGIAATVAGVALARHHYRPAEYGHGQRTLASWLAVVAGAVMTAWMVYAGQVQPIRVTALGALLLIVLVFGIKFAVIKTRERGVKADVDRKQAERKEADETLKAEVNLKKVSHEWEEIFEQAKAGCGLVVVGETKTKGGFYLDILDNPSKPVRYDGFKDMIPSIASIAAARMADRGIELGEEDVSPEQRRAANMFRLHVFTSDAFRKPLAFPTDRPVGTITEPRTLGMYKDTDPVRVTLLGNHGVMVGGTGSGKSVFANNIIASVLECNDAELWIGGTDKLAPLVYPWLLPWFLGRTDKPAIRYVAGQDPQHVTEQLAELYRIAKLRNRKLGRLSVHHPTPDDPAYVYLLEEASDLLMYHQNVRVRTFDGHNWNASELLNVLAKCARSASASVFLLTQFGIMDALGDQGSLMRRNLTFRVVGKTNTYTDGRDILTAMSSVDCTKLRDNTLMVQPSLEAPRVMPAKAFHLENADMIGPIAEKYTARVPSMPRWLHDQMGEAYRKRWDADRLPELFDIVQAEGLTWPGSPSAEVSVSGQSETATNYQESSTMSDEVKATLASANAKMDVAIEQAKKYGPLGPLMGEIFPRVNAENAPDFIPAGHLAYALDRVPEDGDWDAAGDILIGELRGKPWYLVPSQQGGELGWPKGQVLGTIRAFLEGTPVPGQGDTAGTAQGRAMEPLGTLVERLDGDDRDFVTTVEAGGLVGLSAAELQRQLEAEPFSLPSQRPRTPEGERPRGWFVADLRRAAGV